MVNYEIIYTYSSLFLYIKAVKASCDEIESILTIDPSKQTYLCLLSCFDSHHHANTVMYTNKDITSFHLKKNISQKS